MMQVIEQINAEQIAGQVKERSIPNFYPGDTIVVKRRIKEGVRERLQAFEGVVIARNRGTQFNATFTVRKTAYGVSVEYTLPLYSPLTESITVKRRGKVRRSKLFYLRALSGRKARIAEKI